MTTGSIASLTQAMAYYVYILASKKRGTLYIGVTNDIARRVWEHKQGIGSAFTKKYGVSRLVHIETFDKVKLAIQREKTMKEWKRDWKVALIEKIILIGMIYIIG